MTDPGKNFFTYDVNYEEDKEAPSKSKKKKHKCHKEVSNILAAAAFEEKFEIPPQEPSLTSNMKSNNSVEMQQQQQSNHSDLVAPEASDAFDQVFENPPPIPSMASSIKPNNSAAMQQQPQSNKSLAIMQQQPQSNNSLAMQQQQQSNRSLAMQQKQQSNHSLVMQQQSNSLGIQEPSNNSLRMQQDPSFVSCKCSYEKSKPELACNCNMSQNPPSRQISQPANAASEAYASSCDATPPRFETHCHTDPPMPLCTRKSQKDCCNEIILGAREIQAVQAVGRELLQTGKKILQELDFVETLMQRPTNSMKRTQSKQKLDSEYSDPLSNGVPNQGQFTLNLKQSGGGNKCMCGSVTPMRAKESQMTKSAPSEKLMTDLEESKKDFVEAFGRICHSIGQVTGTTGRNSDCGVAITKDFETAMSMLNEIPPTNTKSRPFQNSNSNGAQSQTDATADAVNDRISKLEGRFEQLFDQLRSISGAQYATDVYSQVNGLDKEVARLGQQIDALQTAVNTQMNFACRCRTSRTDNVTSISSSMQQLQNPQQVTEETQSSAIVIPFPSTAIQCEHNDRSTSPPPPYKPPPQPQRPQPQKSMMISPCCRCPAVADYTDRGLCCCCPNNKLVNPPLKVVEWKCNCPASCSQPTCCSRHNQHSPEIVQSYPPPISPHGSGQNQDSASNPEKTVETVGSNQSQNSQIIPNQSQNSQIIPNQSQNSQIIPNQSQNSQIIPNQSKNSQIIPNPGSTTESRNSIPSNRSLQME